MSGRVEAAALHDPRAPPLLPPGLTRKRPLPSEAPPLNVAAPPTRELTQASGASCEGASPTGGGWCLQPQRATAEIWTKNKRRATLDVLCPDTGGEPGARAAALADTLDVCGLTHGDDPSACDVFSPLLRRAAASRHGGGASLRLLRLSSASPSPQKEFDAVANKLLSRGTKGGFVASATSDGRTMYIFAPGEFASSLLAAKWHGHPPVPRSLARDRCLVALLLPRAADEPEPAAPVAAAAAAAAPAFPPGISKRQKVAPSPADAAPAPAPSPPAPPAPAMPPGILPRARGAPPPPAAPAPPPALPPGMKPAAPSLPPGLRLTKREETANAASTQFGEGARAAPPGQ